MSEIIFREKLERIAWILTRCTGGCGFCNAHKDEACMEEEKVCIDNVANYIRAMVLEEAEGEIQQYHSIGTVEECREAMEYLAAHYEGGWIACEERLPEEYGEYLVAWKSLDMTKDQMIKMWGHVVPHFCEIIEYDPDDDEKWIGDIEQAKGKYEIIAWQPLPGYYHPYQNKNNNLNDEIG